LAIAVIIINISKNVNKSGNFYGSCREAIKILSQSRYMPNVTGRQAEATTQAHQCVEVETFLLILFAVCDIIDVYWHERSFAMTRLSTRSLDKIEEKMGGLEEDSMRRRILECAKNFKTSWIELGQSLYAVWKDRLYKEWGYLTFDAYTSKEIGIKKQTALKLLKSYYFLEKEEPSYLQKDYTESAGPGQLPNYESVNVLRLAKNKSGLDKSDYFRLKKDVFERGKDAREVKKDLVSLMRQREELEPEETRNKKRVAMIKRLLAAMKTLRTDLETSKMLPASTIKEVSSLINKIEAQLL